MECATPKVNLNINSGFQLITLYQYWLIICYKRPTLMQNVDRENVWWVGVRWYLGILWISHSIFLVDLKLKN